MLEKYCLTYDSATNDGLLVHKEDSNKHVCVPSKKGYSTWMWIVMSQPCSSPQ